MTPPSPRIHTRFVTPRRRSARGSGLAAGTKSPSDIERWLTGEAITVANPLDLFEAFCWHLLAAGIPIHRAVLSTGTLHPQLVGLSWQWEERDGLCEELLVAADVRDAIQYKESPMYRVIEFGETVRADLTDPDTIGRFPVFRDLAAEGMASYVAMPLTANIGFNRKVMSITMASRARNGLSGQVLADIGRLLRLLAPHIARMMAEQIAANVAAAYLGAAAGRRVMEGSIQRGAGEPVDAVVLVADLRRFTDLSGRLAPEDVLALLNAYFEALVGAVEAEGGEVLKFMGDGLLAVFPIPDASADAEPPRADAAARACRAAAEALAALEALNRDPPPPLAAIEGWRPLQAGLALHLGRVFFGNVGAPGRLDFTVIGPAVNIAARVEGMTKELGRPLLLTEPVAEALPEALEHLGAFTLRGIEEPVALYAPLEKNRITGAHL